MKPYIVLAIAAGALTGALHASPACGDRASSDSMIVSTSSLSQRLKDPNLVLLAVGDQKEFAAAHIPGSRYLDYMDTHYMSAPNGLTLELLPMPDLEQNFAKLGVTNNSRIVLYFTGKSAYSQITRVYLTLDAMGLGAQTSILDGGLPVWKSEGRPVTADIAKIAPGALKACPRTDVIAQLGYVKDHMTSANVRIIDARAPEYYSGATRPQNKRLGHIPGAANLFYSDFFDAQGKFKSREAIAAMFASAGIKPNTQVVSYCHIGQQATVVYFAARLLGYDARMFDGSWEEWSSHTDLPAEVTQKQ